MSIIIQQIEPANFPPLLKEIADPPKILYSRGDITPLSAPSAKFLAVVGSRKATSYGKDVVDYLIGGLRGYPISIISGLALGIDGHAHQAAFTANLHTVAVPGSGLNDDVLYPRSHTRLAQDILSAGGGLLSEYEPVQRAAPWTFPRRNRLMVGLAHAVLLIEATPRSGTLITARLTTEYNRDLLVVPGSIFAHSSEGVHQFLKLGATPVTTPEDILNALHIPILNAVSENNHTEKDLNLSQDEQEIYELLKSPMPRDEIIAHLTISITDANILLSKLELSDIIIEKYGTMRRVH